MAGDDGLFVVVYWNGNKFGDAVQNFYHKNPQLCGPFTGECIDLDTCTLTTPSGGFTCSVVIIIFIEIYGYPSFTVRYATLCYGILRSMILLCCLFARPLLFAPSHSIPSLSAATNKMRGPGTNSSVSLSLLLSNSQFDCNEGYRTHWTTPEEARLVFEEQIGAEVVMLEERGNGVLVAGRRPRAKTEKLGLSES